MGELVRQHLPHASRFTARRTIYTADFGTTERRGCGRSEAKDRLRAGTVEFARHGGRPKTFIAQTSQANASEIDLRSEAKHKRGVDRLQKGCDHLQVRGDMKPGRHGQVVEKFQAVLIAQRHNWLDDALKLVA